MHVLDHGSSSGRPHDDLIVAGRPSAWWPSGGVRGCRNARPDTRGLAGRTRAVRAVAAPWCPGDVAMQDLTPGARLEGLGRRPELLPEPVAPHRFLHRPNIPRTAR